MSTSGGAGSVSTGVAIASLSRARSASVLRPTRTARATPEQTTSCDPVVMVMVAVPWASSWWAMADTACSRSPTLGRAPAVSASQDCTVATGSANVYQ